MFVMACMFDVNPETQLTQAIFHTQALSPNTFPSCSIAVAPSQENGVVKGIAVFTVYIFEPRLSSPANVYTLIRQRYPQELPQVDPPKLALHVLTQLLLYSLKFSCYKLLLLLLLLLLSLLL